MSKNPAAVALGKLGGLKGGKARAKKLSPERRSEIAKKAADIRWANDELSESYQQFQKRIEKIKAISKRIDKKQ